MDSLAAIFGTSLIVSLSGALSPGPLTTLAVREGVRTGFRAGPSLAFGHGVIEFLLVAGLALGLNQLLNSDAVTAAIALLGGAFLVWLGLRTVLSAPRQRLYTEGGPQLSGEGPSSPPSGEDALRLPATSLSLMAAGIAVSVSNPYWVAWWATIGSAYIVESLELGAAGVASFYSAHVLTDIAWLSLVAFALATGRRVMSAGAYRIVLGVSGLALLALGAWFLSSGIAYVL